MTLRAADCQEISARRWRHSTSDCLHSEAVQLGSEGVKVEEHMLSGAPEQALANLATQSNARLVVVSSVGHRPREWLLGSVAERTAEFSLVPTWWFDLPRRLRHGSG